MAQKALVKLQNKDTKEIYFTHKNKKTVTQKLEFKSFQKLRKHVIFKEVKNNPNLGLFLCVFICIL